MLYTVCEEHIGYSHLYYILLALEKYYSAPRFYFKDVKIVSCEKGMETDEESLLGTNNSYQRRRRNTRKRTIEFDVRRGHSYLTYTQKKYLA